MSNKQVVLAYATRQEMGRSELTARLRSATEHVARLFSAPLVVHQAAGSSTGLFVWELENEACGWPAFSADPATGISAAWLHVPALAGDPERGTDPLRLAFDITEQRLEAPQVGAPFAAVTRGASGEVRIANDVFGLARLFRFTFGDLDVWCSRQGLAHVFGGSEPTVNSRAWAGMATLGWATQGVSHMGEGRQIPPYSLTVVAPGRIPDVSSNLDAWLEEVNHSPAPLLRESAADMELSLGTAKYWAQRPVADLSGGKDSRVIAAAAIRAGAVDAVRTVRTDHGEVETAERLMNLIGHPVEHRIQDLSSPKPALGGIEERLHSQQRLWEGCYLAPTVYRTPTFRGISRAKMVRLNGLGGEAMQGGTLLPPNWQKRVHDGGLSAADDRLVSMVRSPLGTSEASKQQVVATIRRLAKKPQEHGWMSGFAAVDYVYNFDKMPFWSNCFGSRETVLPYYAPALLRHIAHSFTNPQPYGEMHRELLRGLIPQWADVPFYKPSARTRATTHIWEYDDWSEARGMLEQNIDRAEAYDSDSLLGILHTVDEGQGRASHETALVRALWEVSFHRYLEEIVREAQAVRREVDALRAGTDGFLGISTSSSPGMPDGAEHVRRDRSSNDASPINESRSL